MEYDERDEGRRLKNFFKDPKNLQYRLNIIIPVIVFLTSILVAVITGTFITDPKTGYFWVLSVSLFSALCSLFAVLAVTQPLRDLIVKAEQLVRFQGKRSERGQMMEVYQLIEKLLEIVKSEKIRGHGDKIDAIESIERLDYLLPLGYMSLMVAHEVRNPLSTITGMSELIKQRVDTREINTYVNTVLDAARKIDVFTKELLDFTDSEIEREDVDINRIVEDAIRAVSGEFKEVKCEFKKNKSKIFKGDSNKLFQSVQNIIKNAFEYEKDGGYVKVETKFGDSIILSVYNSSSFIDEGDLDSIFKPFFTKKKGGRGLGLYLAMRNVKLHGGDIKVESGEKGTKFTIELPGGEVVHGS